MNVVGCPEVSRAERRGSIAGAGEDLRKRVSRTSRRKAVVVLHGRGLQCASQRIKVRAQRGVVVVAEAASDHRSRVVKGPVGKAEARQQTMRWNRLQAARDTSLRVIDDRRTRGAVLRRHPGALADAAGIEAGQEPRGQRRFSSVRKDRSSGEWHRGIKVADVTAGVVVSRVILVADSVIKIQLGRNLPLILHVEIVIDGDAVVVRRHNVVICFLRHADKEIAELLPGKVVAGVKAEGSVVISTEKAERCCRLNVPDVGAKFNRVPALGPGKRIQILDRAGFRGRSQAICVQ